MYSFIKVVRWRKTMQDPSIYGYIKGMARNKKKAGWFRHAWFLYQLLAWLNHLLLHSLPSILWCKPTYNCMLNFLIFFNYRIAFPRIKLIEDAATGLHCSASLIVENVQAHDWNVVFLEFVFDLWQKFYIGCQPT